MNYNKNIPDWQQYNALQSGGSEGAAANMAAPPGSQNVNLNGSFVPNPSSMNTMNPDCLNKSQNYAAHPTGSNGFMNQSPLTPIMHMSNCMNHFGNSSNLNPMMEEINNDTESHNNAMTINGPVNHMVNSNMNNNLVQGSRFPPNNSVTSNNRQTSFIPTPCKGPCCIDPNMNYGYGSYSHTAPYRENNHASNYGTDERRYANSSSRKESHSSKTASSNNQYHVDQRRNRADYKYQKNPNITRNCHQSSVMLPPNCAVQNYNMQTDYMKYHYPSRGPIMPNSTMTNPPSGMIKFHDISKHQYQNMIPNVVPNNNVPGMQNPFYNQMSCRDFSNENRDRIEPFNTRLQLPSGPYAKHQIYRQKFAIQRFSLENQLKEMSRMPGYISNPKYQECVLRYRELLNLQRTVEFQSSIQESSLNANASMGPSVSPINLQFDHNGVLIHSNYLSTNYLNSCNLTNNSNPSSTDHQQNAPTMDQQSGQQISPNVTQETNMAGPSDQQSEFRVPQDVQQNRSSRDFADKPTLDVREFLATWNESEEVENQSVINALTKENTPITVVKLADLNLVTNLAEGQKELSILQSTPTNLQGNGTLEINKVVGVLNCITSSNNEVPTLHIVENLENKIVVEKIDNALNEINNVNIKCIQDIMNKDHSSNVTKQAEPSSHTTAGLTNKTKTIPQKIAKKNDSEIPSDGKNDNCTLELSNPDDLSLPELSTYECIAMSTSLNTPIHSDNEESLEQVTQLRMSANPIEVVQNSPIISFAQQSADAGDKRRKSVDVIDFNPAEVIDNFLDSNKSKESQTLSLPTENNTELESSSKEDNCKTKKVVDGPNVCDKIMEQFCDSSYSNAANVPLIPGDENEELRIPVPPMEDNCLTKIMKNTPPITNISVLNSDSDREEEENWLKVAHVNENLDDDSVDKHHLLKENQISTRKLKKLLKHKSQSRKKMDFKKIKHLFKNDLRQVNISEMFNLLFKRDDDSCKSRSSNNSCDIKHRRRGSNECEENFHEKHRISSKNSKERESRSRSVEPIISKVTNSSEKYENTNHKRSTETNGGTNGNDKNISTEEKCQLLSTLSSKDETEATKFDSKSRSSDFEFELQNLQNKVRKETSDGGIKIEINLSCSDKNVSTKVVTGENGVKDNNLIAGQCEKKLLSKLSNGISKNVKLPQAIQHAEISKRNEFLQSNFTECLTTTTRDKDENAQDHSSGSKPTITNVDRVEISDQLNLFSKTLHSKFRDKFYSPQTFDYPKDIYNLKECKTLSPLKINPILKKPVMEIDCSDPCSSSKHRFYEKITYFDEADSLCRMNPLAFKNYATDISDKDTLNKPRSESPKGFFNPAFLDDINKMNTVPIYTTRDGKITYSPNRKYTYRILFMESEEKHANVEYRKHHLKPRDKKRCKNKEDGKLLKLTDKAECKYDSKTLKTSRTSTDPVRDCVIAIAPGNASAESTSIIKDNQTMSEIGSTSLVLKNKNITLYEPEFSKEACNIIENRSTVIKQLGIPNLIVQEKIEENVIDVPSCTSVICKDNSNMKNLFFQTDEQNNVAKSVLMHSNLVKNMFSSTELKNKITNELKTSNDIPRSSIADEKTVRRHSTSELDQNFLNNVKKSRRNSFESDIIITSIFHDTEHDLRDDIKQKYDALNQNLNIDERNIVRDVQEYEETTLSEKNCPDVSITEKLIVRTEPGSSNIDKTSNDKKESLAPLEISETCQILNETLRNHKALNILEDEKVELCQDKTFRSQIYLEYEHVIIKEEQDEVIDKELPPDLEDELPELEKADEILSIRNPIFHQVLSNDQSDNEYVECPKLESQIDIISKGEKPRTDTTNELGSTWFENKFVEEFKCNEVISQSKEKAIPKLVIRKEEANYSRPTSPVSKYCENNFSKIPKIPKIIIRNTSRPGTPFGEVSRSINAETWSTKTLANNVEEDTKIPKMKINLENALPKVVIENLDLETTQLTVPKMKIRKVKNECSNNQEKEELRTGGRERIPKLKIRKDSNSSRRRERSDSGKRSGSTSSQSSKKSRKFSKDQEELSVSEYECNTNDISVSEKVPKVIIKRTSTRSEFKCELSKSNKSALEWQPRVTLNRSWILDTMAREFRHMKVALKLTTSTNMERLYDQNTIDPNKLQWDNFLSDLKKQKTVQTSSSEMISFDITTSTSRQKRSFLSIKDYSDSEGSLLDENMNSRDMDDIVPKKKMRSFKISNSKQEYMSDRERLKQTEKSSSQTIPNHCPGIGQTEIDDSCTKMSSTLSVRRRSSDSIKKIKQIIEVESSDESQTTIEILPATPDTLEEKEKNVFDEDIPPIQFGVTSFKSEYPEDSNFLSAGRRSNMGNWKKDEKKRSGKVRARIVDNYFV